MPNKFDKNKKAYDYSWSESLHKNSKENEVPVQTYFGGFWQSKANSNIYMENTDDNESDNEQLSTHDNNSTAERIEINNINDERKVEYRNTDDEAINNNQSHIKQEEPSNKNNTTLIDQQTFPIFADNNNSGYGYGMNIHNECDNFDDCDENESINNEDENKSETESWIKNSLYSKIYQHLKKLADNHGVKITIPEILFFGFQSSGKTSTVAAMIRKVTGIMQNGTGNFCPVRFIMSQNNNAKNPIFFVNGQEMKDQEEQVQAVINCMQKLKEKSEFTTNILELRVESHDIPNLVFIDMPGLIKKDNENKYKQWKADLDHITKTFLSEKSSDNITYKYIPVFVKECIDSLNDNDDDIHYIDNLLYNTRPDWKNDTLFVFNKFDKNCNYEKASDYMEYIKSLSRYGDTIITVSNPENKNPSQLLLKDLQSYYQNVIEIEEQWWQHKIISPLRTKNDFQCDNLIKLKKKYCGVKLLKRKLHNKMCDVVKKVLPNIEEQIMKRENFFINKVRQLKNELEKIKKPNDIQQEISEFNDHFLENIREFYECRWEECSHDSLKYGLKWTEEMKEFEIYLHKCDNNNHNHKHHNYYNKLNDKINDNIFDNNDNIIHIISALNWHKLYFISNINLLKKLFQHGNRNDLIEKMDMKLQGRAAMNRFIDYWIAMICYMKFPNYSKQDIENFKKPYDCTIQDYEWSTARNMVSKATNSIKDGARYFSQYFRWKFQYDGQIIFQNTLTQRFGEIYDINLYNNSNNQQKQTIDKLLMSSTDNNCNNIEKLARISLKDYNKKIDDMIFQFIKHCSCIPHNLAENLDQRYADNITNLYSLLQCDLPSITKQYTLDANVKENKNLLDMLSIVQNIPLTQLTKLGSGIGLAIHLLPKIINISNQTISKNLDNNINNLEQKNNNVDALYSNFDIDCYEKCFPNESQTVFYHQDRNQFVYLLGSSYWKIIKNKFIHEMIKMFGDRLMTPISKTNSLSGAINDGVDNYKKLQLIKQLSLLYNITASKIEQTLSNLQNDDIVDKTDEKIESDYEIIDLNIPVKKMNHKQLLKLYGDNSDIKEKELQEIKKQYREFLKNKEDTENIIHQIKIATKQNY